MTADGAPLISVVIVNYNGGDYLQKAVDSLAAQTFQDFEVFVVDNASTDGSADSLNGVAPEQFTLIRSDENLGFAAGNNMAARMARGEWLVLLNPDAAAQPDWLDAIVDATRRHAGVNMFACLQRRMHEPGMLDGTGDCYFGFGIPWRGGFGRSDHETPQEGECFSACGASAVYRRDLFVRHGGFDEAFFCFGEDTDLAFRLRASGETCLFIPGAVVLHAGGALSGRVSRFSIWHGARNRFWTYWKNMPGWSLWLTLPGHIGFTALILGRGLMTGRFRATLDGLVAALRDFPRVQAQRCALEKARTATVSDLLRVMSWNPLRFLTRRSHVQSPRPPKG